MDLSFTGLVDLLVGMIIQYSFGYQLNLEDGGRHRQERPLLLTLAFNNVLTDRKYALKY